MLYGQMANWKREISPATLAEDVAMSPSTGETSTATSKREPLWRRNRYNAGRGVHVMPPTERPAAKDLERYGTDRRPPHSDLSANAGGVHWLDDFMLREGIIRDPLPLLGDRQRLGRPHEEKREAAHEPMWDGDDVPVKSRHVPAVAGAAALLLVLGLAAAASIRLSHSSAGAPPQASGTAIDQPPRRADAVAARRPPPKPMQSPAPPGRAEPAERRIERALPLSKIPSAVAKTSIDFAVLSGVSSPLWSKTAAGFPGYPQQAFGLPPDALSDGAAAPTLTSVMLSLTRTGSIERTTSRSSEWPMAIPPPQTVAALQPAAVAPAPPTEGATKLVVAKPTGPQTAISSSGPLAAQRDPHPALPPDAPPARNQPTVGTPLRLQIVFAPWGPQEAKAFAALQAKMKSQVGNIATVGQSEWPVRHEVVIYFFPGDRAAASQVAASLAEITKRPAPMMMLRTKSAPQPGTVDILLPLRIEEGLINDAL